MQTHHYISRSEDETLEIGAKLAESMRAGDLFAIDGDLGSGKTELVRGICQALGVEELVSSPTFTIVNEYNGQLATGAAAKIYHVDLYRLEQREDLEQIGLPEIFADLEVLKLVEWCERAATMLPSGVCRIRLVASDEEEATRNIYVEDCRSEQEPATPKEV